MKNGPAFQLYASDFYMDVLSWNTDEVGTYFLLLLAEWVNGPLENNPVVLARYVRQDVRKFRKIWTKLRKKFVVTSDGLLHNIRLEQTRKEQMERRQVAIDSGRKGGLHTQENRRNKPSDPSSDPSSENKALQSSSSPSLKETISKEISKKGETLPIKYPEYHTPEYQDLKSQAIKVLEYLNEKCGKNFQAMDSNLKDIIAALQDNISVDDMKRIVDVKLHDEHFQKHRNLYKPSTLFGKHLHEYVQEKLEDFGESELIKNNDPNKMYCPKCKKVFKKKKGHWVDDGGTVMGKDKAYCGKCGIVVKA